MEEVGGGRWEGKLERRRRRQRRGSCRLGGWGRCDTGGHSTDNETNISPHKEKPEGSQAARRRMRMRMREEENKKERKRQRKWIKAETKPKRNVTVSAAVFSFNPSD